MSLTSVYIQHVSIWFSVYLYRSIIYLTPGQHNLNSDAMGLNYDPQHYLCLLSLGYMSQNQLHCYINSTHLYLWCLPFEHPPLYHIASDNVAIRCVQQFSFGISECLHCSIHGTRAVWITYRYLHLLSNYQSSIEWYLVKELKICIT